MGYWYMGKLAGEWHLLAPYGGYKMKDATQVETECGDVRPKDLVEHLHETPAFCRAGDREDRCRRCRI